MTLDGRAASNVHGFSTQGHEEEDGHQEDGNDELEKHSDDKKDKKDERAITSATAKTVFEVDVLPPPFSTKLAPPTDYTRTTRIDISSEPLGATESGVNSQHLMKLRTPIHILQPHSDAANYSGEYLEIIRDSIEQQVLDVYKYV